MRKLASIRRIADIQPIKGADAMPKLGDIIFDKEEQDGLLFVVTELYDDWFRSIAIVANNNVIHRKFSFDGAIEVVGNIPPQNFHLYSC